MNEEEKKQIKEKYRELIAQKKASCGYVKIIIGLLIFLGISLTLLSMRLYLPFSVSILNVIEYPLYFTTALVPFLTLIFLKMQEKNKRQTIQIIKKEILKNFLFQKGIEVNIDIDSGLNHDDYILLGYRNNFTKKSNSKIVFFMDNYKIELFDLEEMRRDDDGGILFMYYTVFEGYVIKISPKSLKIIENKKRIRKTIITEQYKYIIWKPQLKERNFFKTNENTAWIVCQNIEDIINFLKQSQIGN